MSELYEKLYELRSKQSECGLAERAVIQAQIIAVLAQIDAMSKGK